jgi:curved DNA-binding protein CbpA
MGNLFELLSLPASLLVSSDQVDEAWRKLSRENHPDLGRDTEEDVSSRLNEARSTLSSPAGLLEQWLIANGEQISSRNISLGESLLDLFSETGSSLQVADEAIGAIRKSQTALARSLLTSQAIAAQTRIQSQMGRIGDAIERITSRFPEFEKMALENNYKEAVSALGELKFLEKWKGQCQSRLLDLISLD